MTAGTIEARAKVNLFLRVGPARADGFHDLATVFHSVALCDLLHFELMDVNDAGRPFFDFEFLCDDPGIGEGNLVPRAAARIVAEWESDRTAPGPLQKLRIELEKRLPVGAGLAGGSADAAATIDAVNRIYNFGFDSEVLASLAAELGSDVAFCLKGGCSLGRGRGEILSPLPLLPECAVAIAVPPFAIATADAYRWLDEHRASSSHPSEPPPGSEDPALDLLIKALQKQDLQTIGLLLHNDFEGPVFQRHPELEQLRDAALRQGAAGALLSGSGSALFALCEDSARANKVSSNWEKALPGTTVHVSSPAASGLYEAH